ncbi:immunity protein Imm33 domain-containing protein [Flavihumibacter sp. UBA7668]|uniref:immunity protein Imm33 domain-containing protein n=1 Tax=Flavihumibacter sp. UBA7668 TaxID=1946542 RepID=UPI0025BBE481|nr:hypothetical protein [Flavihumibacter sp. UBA7668]
MEIDEEQKEVCHKYEEHVFPSPFSLNVGISLNVKGGTIFPINGLRHPPEGDTTGWYIWAVESFSNDPSFFVPLHVEHLKSWYPQLLKFLGLPPGYRFLIGEDNYEDVWYDPSLLEV